MPSLAALLGIVFLFSVCIAFEVSDSTVQSADDKLDRGNPVATQSNSHSKPPGEVFEFAADSQHETTVRRRRLPGRRRRLLARRKIGMRGRKLSLAEEGADGGREVLDHSEDLNVDESTSPERTLSFAKPTIRTRSRGQPSKFRISSINTLTGDDSKQEELPKIRPVTSAPFPSHSTEGSFHRRPSQRVRLATPKKHLRRRIQTTTPVISFQDNDSSFLYDIFDFNDEGHAKSVHKGGLTPVPIQDGRPIEEAEQEEGTDQFKDAKLTSSQTEEEYRIPEHYYQYNGYPQNPYDQYEYSQVNDPYLYDQRRDDLLHLDHYYRTLQNSRHLAPARPQFSFRDPYDEINRYYSQDRNAHFPYDYSSGTESPNHSEEEVESHSVANSRREWPRQEVQDKEDSLSTSPKNTQLNQHFEEEQTLATPPPKTRRRGRKRARGKVKEEQQNNLGAEEGKRNRENERLKEEEQQQRWNEENQEDTKSVFDQYKYGYSVAAEDTGTYHTRSEERDGKRVSGSYKVALPDGRIQVVTYVADDDGFRADVTYEGEAILEEPTTNAPRREQPRTRSTTTPPPSFPSARPTFEDTSRFRPFQEASPNIEFIEEPRLTTPSANPFRLVVDASRASTYNPTVQVSEILSYYSAAKPSPKPVQINPRESISDLRGSKKLKKNSRKSKKPPVPTPIRLYDASADPAQTERLDEPVLDYPTPEQHYNSVSSPHDSQYTHNSHVSDFELPFDSRVEISKSRPKTRFQHIPVSQTAYLNPQIAHHGTHTHKSRVSIHDPIVQITTPQSNIYEYQSQPESGHFQTSLYDPQAPVYLHALGQSHVVPLLLPYNDALAFQTSTGAPHFAPEKAFENTSFKFTPERRGARIHRADIYPVPQLRLS